MLNQAKAPASDAAPTFKVWKAMVPYGRWTCADGRQVLFNHQYWPILERRLGEPVTAANPNDQLAGFAGRIDSAEQLRRHCVRASWTCRLTRSMRCG